nr:uncharacterized protein K02A2.6-like [Onthophagus taurus]
MDVFTQELNNKVRKFLVTVDQYSDYFELDLLKDLTPKTLIECCKMNFSRYGIPEKICSDNGTNFASVEFRRFCNSWEIQHTTSSPHHPKGNGKAESAVKIAKRLIKKAIEDRRDIWYSILHWRNTPDSTREIHEPEYRYP